MGKKILILTLDISISGGVERVTSLLGNGLINNNEVTILSIFGENKEAFYYLESRVKLIYLFNTNFKLKTGINKIGNHLKIFLGLLNFFRINKKYDFVISMFDNLTIYSSFSKMKKKIIAFQHGQFYAHGKIVRLIRRWRYKKLAAIVSLTETDKKLYEKIKKDNIYKIPNPLSFEIDKKSNLMNKEMIAVGRLVKEKGFENLINLMIPILRKNKEWKLSIYGEGELRKKIEKLIKDGDIEKQIILKGNSNNIKEEYLKASIYLCSSLTESFSMTILEAMACGVVVVSFDCPTGPRELIQDKVNGFLIENQNMEVFAKKVEEIMETNNNDLIQLGNHAIDSVRMYEINKIVNKWEELFEKL